jgi:hypothetical protein
MFDKILAQMKRGVYYPGHHLGPREKLDQLVLQGYLERMDASFLCGPDSEPTYCLSEPARPLANKSGRTKPPDEIKRQPR